MNTSGRETSCGAVPWSRSALAEASNRNLLGLPTLAPIIAPDPAPDASASAKTWAETWNGTWTCPASMQHLVQDKNGKSSTQTFPVTLMHGMWCVETGSVVPEKATITAHDTISIEAQVNGYGKSYLSCPRPYNVQPDILHINGWCINMWALDGLNIRPAFLATYTPPPGAPTIVPTSGGATLTCPKILPTPAKYPLFLQGSWCLPPGADIPVLARNNQCDVGRFQDGWCIALLDTVNGQSYGPLKPVDPTIPPPFDAADPLRFDYVSFTYTCPADSYHPSPYTTTGAALGAPRAPFTANSPCLSQAKARETASCGSGASGFSNAPALRIAQAELAYDQCLATNSTEPFKTRYLAMAQDQADRVDFFQNACTYPQVKRNGVCVNPPAAQPAPTPGSSSSSAAACLTAYTGPDTDPQTDSFCKQAAFDACLHRITGQTAYDKEGRAACTVLGGLLEAIGATKTYSCTYCPYPY